MSNLYQNKDKSLSLSYISNSKLFLKSIWRIQDVADYLGVSKGHIYNLSSRREIPSIKKGKHLYFIPKEIEDWVLQGN